MGSVALGEHGIAARRRAQRRRTWLVGALGCLVVVATAVALMVPAVSMTKGDLACGLEEHAHTEACYTLELTCGEDEADGHEHSDACYEEVLTCEKAEHDHTDACYEQEGGDGEDSGDEDAEDLDDPPASQAPAAGEAQSEAADEDAEAPEDADAPGDADPDPEQDAATAEAATPVQSFYGELRDKDDNVTLAVDVDAPEGALPEGTSMQVKAVKAKDVKAAVEDALEREDAGKLDTLQAVDITFLDADGEEVEPAVAVNVRLSSPQIADATEADRQPLVVHVDDEGAAELVDVLSDKQLEKRDITRADDELVFDAESFSVYAIVYTVDFHWNVDGKTYDFSIPGGGFISLEHLVEVLGVASTDTNTENETEIASENAVQLNNVVVSEATKEFVADIDNVEFSNPDLVWLGKVDVSATVSELKEANGLDVEYSAGLTEGQIAEINAQTVNAGDWALISLQPFTSEESLTITMNNGDQFVVKVTDALADSVESGKEYVLFTESSTAYYGSPGWVVLKNDGSQDVYPKNYDFTSLGNEYWWTIASSSDYDAKAYGIRGKSSGTYLNLKTENVSFTTSLSSTIIAPRSSGGGFDLYGGSSSTGYYYLAWNNGWKMSSKKTAPTAASGARIRLFSRDPVQKDTYTITVTQDDISRGNVSYNGAGNANYATTLGNLSISEETKSTVNHDANNQECKEANYSISANISNTDYEFSHWEVSGSGQVLEWGDSGVTEVSRKIKPKVTGDVTLTAIFTQKTTQTYPPLPYNRTDLDSWMLDQVLGKTVTDVNKTAEVYDYENRIYQIDITGRSNIKALSNDIALAFVTDISNSMLFPEDVQEVKKSDGSVATVRWKSDSSISSQLDVYANSGVISKSEIYATIGDNSNTATQYILFHSNGQTIKDQYFNEGWYALDASYYSKWIAGELKYDNIKVNGQTRFVDLSTARKLHNSGDSDGKAYILYTPNESFAAGLANADTLYIRNGRYGSVTGNNRLYYLVDSLYQAVWQMKYISQNYPMGAIYAGVETFASNTGDASNHQDFVQIGGAVNHGSKSYDDNISAIQNKITNITTKDGTNQYQAIKDLSTYLHWDNLPDKEKIKKYIIMISDGAPNAKDKTADDMIRDIPGKLPEGAKLITVGLSMDEVEAGKKLMYSVSSLNDDENHMYYSAERGEDLTFVLMEIMRSIMEDATVNGNVEDVIDPAFYPVDKMTGDPIELNTNGEAYIDKEGNVLAAKPTGGNAQEYGTITCTGDEWAVTWSGQDIKPTGWHGRVFVKSKEDFLGGNGIETNTSASLTPISYRIVHEDGTSSATADLGAKKKPVAMESPRVNVDELDFTKRDTEWTVYRSTNIDPLTQIYNLYKNINVTEVVTDEGNGHRKSEVGKKVYSLTSGDDADSISKAIMDGRPLTESDRTTIPLSEVISQHTESPDGTIANSDLTLEEWKSLISGETVARIYTEYGHKAGEIILTLSQLPEVKITEEDADNVLADPAKKAEHPATGSEEYVLNVKYVPYEKDAYATGEYRTVHSGLPTEEIGSDSSSDAKFRGNEHVIHVFEGALVIEKTDAAGNVIKEAEFEIYQKDGDSGDQINPTHVATSNGLYRWNLNNKQYVVPDENQAIPGSYWKSVTEYYIRESNPPTGYAAFEQEIPVTLEIRDVKIDLTGNNGAALYNWTQAASLSAEDVADYVTVTGDGDIKISVKNDKSVDIEVVKTDNAGTEIGGAKFSLKKGAALVRDFKVIKRGGSWQNQGDRVDVNGGVFEVPAGGVTLLGLGAGDYTLDEVEQPAGYLKTIQPIMFTINREGVVTYTNALDNPAPSVVSLNEDKQYKVQNMPGTPLPNTGGIGDEIVYLFGLILITAGAALLLARRRATR